MGKRLSKLETRDNPLTEKKDYVPSDTIDYTLQSKADDLDSLNETVRISVNLGTAIAENK